VLSRLGTPSKAEVKPDDDPKKADTRTILNKLFGEIAPRFADRPGGYTRVIKRHKRRLGDAGETAYLELLKEGETKVQKRAPAPAPKVSEPAPVPPPPGPIEMPKTEETPAAEAPKAETEPAPADKPES